MLITVRIYNATGGELTLVRRDAWHGGVFNSSPPEIIQEYEEGVFELGVNRPDSTAAGGAVVYRINNNKNDCLVAFRNLSNAKNQVLARMRDEGEYNEQVVIEHKKLLDEANPFYRDATHPGLGSIATITQKNSNVNCTNCSCNVSHQINK